MRITSGKICPFAVAAISPGDALLEVLNVPTNQARPLTAALVDWLDSDQQPVLGGAEDSAYLSGDRQGRPPNQLMSDADEMAGVLGMDVELFAKLKPWVCALPIAGASPINVNTILPAQAPLIAMMIPGQLSVQKAKAMIEARPSAGFDSGQAFWASAASEGLTPPASVVEQTQVKTRFFTLKAKIALAGAEHQQWSLIDVDKPPAKVVARKYGGKE